MDELWALPAESAHTWLYPLRARLFASRAASPSVTADGGPSYQRCEGIAVIGISGVITRQSERGIWGERLTQGQDEILRAVAAAQEDPDVRALFFRINSPGGVVAGTKELADAIAAGPKPAGAYADGQATSAAFWLASATGRIYAPATAMLGSVGVISEVVSLSGYLRRQGIAPSRWTRNAAPICNSTWTPCTPFSGPTWRVISASSKARNGRTRKSFWLRPRCVWG